MNIRTKRVYDPADPADGCRILVDRLWPRGLAKENARIDLWLKAIAPSGELRKWYGHDPARWPEFKRRYFAELEANGEAVAELRSRVEQGPVSLLYGSREQRYNNATAIKLYLEGRVDQA